MGACTFNTCGQQGETDVTKAYRDACDRAQYERGHNGYNGTISTTAGVVVVQGLLTPIKQDAIRAITDPIINSDQNKHGISKWGNAGAIAVAKDDGTFDRWYFFGWAAE